MKITILGGGGFIGSHLTNSLLSDGHSVIVFERPGVTPYRQFSDSEPITWIAGDMSNAVDVARGIEGADAVVHLVSSTVPKTSNDDPIFDVQSNLVSTLNLLKAMVAQDIRKLIFISSGGTIYGSPLYIPLDENHPTNPYVSYGIVKLAIEKYLLMFQKLHGIRTIVLRVSNPYGERQRIESAQGVVGAFLYKALRAMPLEIWGDGSIVRDYIYVGDVADAFRMALSYSGPESVFNIGSGVGTSLIDLVKVLETLFAVPIKCEFRRGRPIDVPVNVLDNSLARRELNWEPQTQLIDGIAKTVDWLKRV